MKKNKQKYIRVPYAKSVHGLEEIEAVVKILKTSTQMGQKVRKFESKIARLFNKKYGIMVNSGSSANYLAVEILKLPSKGEVITPVLTFSTTVAPLIKDNLVPSFVDVSKGTYNINTDLIEDMITKKTVAMMIPNLIGNLPDWDKIKSIAEKHNLKVIEDSADTLGATLRNESTGTRSEVSTTSFYGSHIINCAGNGGMLCVNDPKLAEKAKLLRSWGRSSSLFVESEKIENRFDIKLDKIPYDAKFVFEEIGYNLEPSEIEAVFGLVQLKSLEKNISKRVSNFKEHYKFFSKYKDWFILPKEIEGSRTGWLAFPLTIKDTAPFTRRELQIYLEKRNIQTRTVFTGNILRQPGFKNIKRVENQNGYKVADEVMRGGFLIACHHGLTQNQLEHIHKSFSEFAINVKR